jgi:hypothetical protein
MQPAGSVGEPGARTADRDAPGGKTESFAKEHDLRFDDVIRLKYP